MAVSYGVGCRHDLAPMLLWLWWRPAATALIQPLAREPPYAMSAAPNTTTQKNKKKKEIKNTKIKNTIAMF